MNKYLHLGYRYPRTKEEKECFGITYADSTAAEIFVNTQKNQKSEVLIDTFFHEMTHVFFAFHGVHNQMSPHKEEKLAKAIGKACKEILE